MNSQSIESGKSIVVKPDNQIEISDFTIRPPGEGEVLVKTVSSLISAGTELGSQEQQRTHDFTRGIQMPEKLSPLGMERRTTK